LGDRWAAKVLASQSILAGKPAATGLRLQPPARRTLSGLARPAAAWHLWTRVL